MPPVTTFLSQAIFVASIMHILLGLIVTVQAKDKSRFFFVGVTFILALWSLSNFFIYTGSTILSVKLAYTTGALVTTSLMVWVYHFLFHRIDSWKIIVLVVCGIFFALSPFIGNILIYNIVLDSSIITGFTQSLGPLFLLYSLFHIFLHVTMLVLLFKGYKRAILQNRKRQIQLIAWSIGIFITFAIVFNFILPLLNINTLINFDVPASMIVVAMMVYAILRYSLFNIKVVLTHILVIFLWFTLLIQLALTAGTTNIIIGIVTLILVVIFGFFLIRSVEKEVSQRKELEKLAERLRNFVSFASHELRGPVSKFKSVLSMIFEGDFGKISPETKKVLKDTFIEAENMGQTIDMFLNLNRLEVGEFVLNYRLGNLKTLIQTVLTQVQYQAEKKSITINFNESGNISPICFDFFKIQHVVKNIIDNAIKYTPEGGHIAISLIEDESRLKITFRDSGVGMTQDALENVFTKYQQGKSVPTSAIEGHGIGMWLSYKIVDLHNGNITAESAGPNKGTTFTLILPAIRTCD